MTTTDEILRLIEKGGTLDELAKVLGMSKSLLVARIEFLVPGVMSRTKRHKYEK
jgi:predicted transcriptional regulator